jgi:hypothetical protein
MMRNVSNSPDSTGGFPSELLTLVEGLRSAVPLRDGYYYFFEFSVDSSGKPFRSYQTEFIGWSEGKPRREIRQASEIDAEAVIDRLTKIGTPPMVINKPEDFFLLIMFGGVGLVERCAVPDYLDFGQPKEMARDSSGLGFRSLDGLPKDKLQHAPTKKLRMKVLKRDNARCLICGRSPVTYVDVELHVHHVIPWGEGGITRQLQKESLSKDGKGLICGV